MDFSFSEDQEALRELARKIFEERAGHERLKEIERSEERIDRELWQELARANLLGVAIAETHGGSGLGLPELALLLVEAGRAPAPLPLVPCLLGAALPLERFGEPAAAARWLPRVASGETILSAGLDGELCATPDGAGWRLQGKLPLVAAVHVAERLLVPAATPDGMALFLLDPRADGIRTTRQELTSGEPRFDLALEGVPIAAEDLGVPAARGAQALRFAREHAVAGQCALLLGNAERALERTAAYAGERKQFDRPIGSFQAVHQRAGDAFIDLDAIRLTCWQAVHRLAQAEPAEEALCVAKYWAARAGHRVTYAAQHLHGGIGLDVDYPLHRHYLQARTLALELGNATEHLTRLGDLLARGDVP